MNLPNGFVATATELNTQTKYCLAKREKRVNASNDRWQWAG